ncbi:MAG: glycosyltransferase family 4 protein, partial [Burkholderiales bacterium]
WSPPSPRSAVEIVLGRGIVRSRDSDKEDISRSATQDTAILPGAAKLDLAGHAPQVVVSAVPPPASETTPSTATLGLKGYAPQVVVSAAPPTPEATPSIEKLTFLFVNDEWSSGNGGISTINRDLCLALANMGHDVVCFIPEAPQGVIEIARRERIQIITSGQYPGASTFELLARGPLNPLSIRPDVVVGHDQVTGRHGLALAREVYRCPYLHVVHSSPEELEYYKDREDEGARRTVNHLKGSKAGEVQAQMCESSDMVLAIGPLLTKKIASTLLGKKSADDIVEVIPGLDGELLGFSRTFDRDLEARCLLSGRLDDKIVKGTDFFLRIVHAFQGRPLALALKGTQFVMRGFSEATLNDQIKALQESLDRKVYNISPRSYITDKRILDQDLKSAAIFLMPSKLEGFGLTGLDAIAAGIPLIVSARSGLGELLIRAGTDLPARIARIASDSVLDVEPDGDPILANWTDKLIEILSTQKKAFSEADDLRNALKDKWSWKNAAEAVVMAARKALEP